jgi:formylglycine-generating enzyme required for sulfatase activity
MSKLVGGGEVVHIVWFRALIVASLLAGGVAVFPAVRRVVAADTSAAAATSADGMKPFTQKIDGTGVTFDMVPIPGGTYIRGSSEDEADRGDDEGPQHPVRVDPFWMGTHEVTWDEYDIWSFNLDVQRRKVTGEESTDRDKIADVMTRPTKPYTDMSFGMGRDGYPAICMTQWAAKKYCEWLSAKTGVYYRLPTEAEWEYACRAGTTTAYSFGDDPEDLDDYAWYFDNSDDAYQLVGQKKPNPWGLYDIHGNVAEWVLDDYQPDTYAELSTDEPNVNPYVPPTAPYSQIVRGGSWDDDADKLRSAARRGSDPSWKAQDPQIPQSIWYHTDAQHVGFRLVRPLVEPSEEQKAKYIAAGSEAD